LRLLLLLLLFFSCHAAHPSRHSFPTRRSSDLPVGAGGLLQAQRQDRADQLVLFALGAEKVAQRIRREHPASILRRQPPGVLQHIDRKSTRLNSSHVSISYAVFCLKKKNSRAAH